METGIEVDPTGVLNSFFRTCGAHNSSGMKVDDDEWHHLAVTADSFGITQYVDGISTAHEIGDVLTPSALGWRLGIPVANMYKSSGQIDDLAFFNVALEEDDIQTLMNRGLKVSAAVDVSGKLTTTWSAIKAR